MRANDLSHLPIYALLDARSLANLTSLPYCQCTARVQGRQCETVSPAPRVLRRGYIPCSLFAVCTRSLLCWGTRLLRQCLRNESTIGYAVVAGQGLGRKSQNGYPTGSARLRQVTRAPTRLSRRRAPDREGDASHLPRSAPSHNLVYFHLLNHGRDKTCVQGRPRLQTWCHKLRRPGPNQRRDPPAERGGRLTALHLEEPVEQ